MLEIYQKTCDDHPLVLSGKLWSYRRSHRHRHGCYCCHQPGDRWYAIGRAMSGSFLPASTRSRVNTLTRLSGETGVRRTSSLKTRHLSLAQGQPLPSARQYSTESHTDSQCAAGNHASLCERSAVGLVRETSASHQTPNSSFTSLPLNDRSNRMPWAATHIRRLILDIDWTVGGVIKN
jgi:hypothetical protein